MAQIIPSQTQTLIFDLDGTLWDSCATVAKAWTIGAAEMGRPDLSLSPAQVQTTMGLTFDEIFEKLWPFLSHNERRLIGHHCETVETALLLKEPGTLYAGVAELIPQLAQKYQLMIVSNCQTGYIENFLHHSGLESYFADWECFGDTQKPKSENIQMICQRNQVQNAVYIGDTHKDQTSALAAGLPFVFAAWGFGSVEVCDLEFDSFRALGEFFLEVNS